MKGTYHITLTKEELRLISWSVLSEAQLLAGEDREKQMMLHDRLVRVLFGEDGDRE